jgi:pimeloyl-ACP methyl ester carboxylesterase
MKRLALILFASLLSQYAVAIKPDRVYRFYPEKVGLMYKRLDVVTPDGLRIETWFYPAQERLLDKELDAVWENPVKRPYATLDNARRPTLIICNGDATNMTWTQIGIAERLTAEGYNVVTFDWRGFGESDEWEMNPDYLCYTEMLTDYNAVIEAVVRQSEVDASRVGVMGWSTGAYLSMAAAGVRPEVKCLVAQALMTSFDDIMPLVMPLPHNGPTGRKLIVPSDYPESLIPVNLAPNFDKAVLLIVGSEDVRTPVWMSQKIYDALPLSLSLPGKKELWVVPDAEHGGPNGPWKNLDEYCTRVKAFLDINL